MASMSATISQQELERINRSRDSFDLSAELTDDERKMLGDLTRSHDDSQIIDVPVRIKDIEEDDFTAVDVVELVTTNQDYNERYAYFTRCQSLASLLAYEEGWNNFQELVLKAYVRQRRLDDQGYKGDDRDRSHALRLRKLAAEDFLKYINGMMAEAKLVKRPSVKS